MCSPDEICKKDKCEGVVTHAETVSLEKGIHSYFEILLNYVTFFVPNSGFISGAPARAKRARSGAPWVTKFGKLSIRENLVMT